MVIDINKTNILWVPVTYYTVKGNNQEIEKITIDGVELDLTNDADLVKAINALLESKQSVNTSEEEANIAANVFGIGNFNELASKFNEITDNLIYKIETMRYDLRKKCTPEVNTPCECSLDMCHKNCEEDAQAEQAASIMSNCRTFHWASKYMEEVIDPNDELSGAEYNTLLAMFAQYGEWILNQ